MTVIEHIAYILLIVISITVILATWNKNIMKKTYELRNRYLPQFLKRRQNMNNQHGYTKSLRTNFIVALIFIVVVYVLFLVNY